MHKRKEVDQLVLSNSYYKEYRGVLSNNRQVTPKLYIFNLNDIDDDDEDIDEELEQRIKDSIKKFDAELYQSITHLITDSSILESLKTQRVNQPEECVFTTISQISSELITDELLSCIVEIELTLLKKAKNLAGEYLHHTDIETRIEQLELKSLEYKKSNNNNVAPKSFSQRRRKNTANKNTFLEQKESPQIIFVIDDIATCNKILDLILHFLRQPASKELEENIKIQLLIASALQNKSFNFYFQNSRFSNPVYEKNFALYRNNNESELMKIKDSLNNMNPGNLLTTYQICTHLKKNLEFYIPKLKEISLDKQETINQQLLKSSWIAKLNIQDKKTKSMALQEVEEVGEFIICSSNMK